MGKRGHNEGTICQRSDGRWVAVVNLGYGPDGKRKRKSFYGKTRKEVADKLRQALQDHTSGLPIDPKRMSLSDFLTSWLEDSVKPSVRVTTYENYKTLVNTHIMPSLGQVQLQKLSPQQIQQFLNYKLESGLSTRTVQYLLVLLRRSLGLAVKWALVQRNVALLVDPPRVKSKVIQPFTPAQARQFLEALRGDKFEALYTVALALGLRRGEALGLRWDDIDWEKGTLTIRASLQRAEGKLQLLEVKTDRSRRVVKLPKLALLALKSHRTRQLEDRLLAGARWKEHGLVFPTGIGTPYDPRRLNEDFEKALKRAGLPRIRFHDLRHSAATLLLAQGVPVKTISELLGHSTTRMTLDVYAHVLETMKQEAADSMDAVLGQAM
jgi:integrase